MHNSRTKLWSKQINQRINILTLDQDKIIVNCNVFYTVHIILEKSFILFKELLIISNNKNVSDWTLFIRRKKNWS